MMPADAFDLLGDLVRRLAVTGVQMRNIESFDTVQRVGESGQTAEALGRLDRDVPVPAGVGVEPGNQLIAAEQRARVGLEEDAVAWRMAGRRDEDDAPISEPNLGAVGQLLIGAEGRAADQAGPAFASHAAARVVARAKGAAHPLARLDESRDPLLGHAHAAHVLEDVLGLVADDVASVQERLRLERRGHDRHALGLPTKGQAAMVDVGVRDRHVPDVADVQTRGVQLRRKRIPSSVVIGPGVDHDHAVRGWQRVRPVIAQRDR